MIHSFPIPRALIIAGLAAALLWPLSAGARSMERHEGFERRIERLDLDEATRASVDQVLDETRSQRRALRRALRAARERMHELLASADSDEATLMAQAEAISTIQLEMRRERIETHLKLRTILTSDQMETLALAAAERRERPRRRFRR